MPVKPDVSSLIPLPLGLPLVIVAKLGILGISPLISLRLASKSAFLTIPLLSMALTFLTNLRIAPSVVEAAAVNSHDIKAFLANSLSTFPIKAKPTFSNCHESLLINPPDRPILCN